jgi:hypothetical protein
MIRRTAAILGLSAALAWALAPAPALAAAKERTAEPKRKVLRLEAITVEGKFQKPEAFYILQRANPEFAEPEKAESFLPRIVKSQESQVF